MPHSSQNPDSGSPLARRTSGAFPMMAEAAPVPLSPPTQFYPLSVMRGALDIADDPTPCSPADPRTLALPNGRVIALERRGVRWTNYTINGQPVICAYDSKGDIGSHWRVVPLTATAEEIDEIERQLQRELDMDDPPIRLL